MWAGCTLSDREADSEVRSYEYPPHGEYGLLTAMILETYILFSSSLGKRMSNVKRNTGVASSNLERFDAYDKITCFVLYYSKARALYRIYMSPLLDKIASGVCQGCSVSSSMFSHFHSSVCACSFPSRGPPFILRLLI